jgi:hypothetical protein
MTMPSENSNLQAVVKLGETSVLRLLRSDLIVLPELTTAAGALEPFARSFGTSPGLCEFGSN